MRFEPAYHYRLILSAYELGRVKRVSLVDLFVGGKDVTLNKGVIIVLGGETTDNLRYKFYLGPYYELGDMGECPSYFKVNGKDVLLASFLL